MLARLSVSTEERHLPGAHVSSRDSGDVVEDLQLINLGCSSA